MEKSGPYILGGTLTEQQRLVAHSGRHLLEKDQAGNASLDHFVGPDK